jgi:hypothetical protein
VVKQIYKIFDTWNLISHSKNKNMAEAQFLDWLSGEKPIPGIE